VEECMKSIIDVYNDGQDKYRATLLKDGRIQLMDKYSIIYYIGTYEFIANPRYAVIETIGKDKETRDDFKKWFKGKTGNRFIVDNYWIMMKYAVSGFLEKPAEQMLKGYWEEYLINRFKERE